jgi:hypothetical protein
VSTNWNKTEPPKDGKPIVAIGAVIERGLCTVSTPFCAAIYWDAASKEWLLWSSRLSVRECSSDELVIHFWLPYPGEGEVAA